MAGKHRARLRFEIGISYRVILMMMGIKDGADCQPRGFGFLENAIYLFTRIDYQSLFCIFASYNIGKIIKLARSRRYRSRRGC